MMDRIVQYFSLYYLDNNISLYDKRCMCIGHGDCLFYFVTLESRVRQLVMLKLFAPFVEQTNLNKFLFRLPYRLLCDFVCYTKK